jgi:glycosyltransferase involved in cell wall biosynthesis
MGKVWAAEPNARLRILASPGDVAPILISDSRVDATWDGYSNEQLELELAAAKVVCLPYTSASGSGVAAQAYGSGKLIVASDLEGLKELVAHNELLAKPTDEADLARALIAALRHEYGPQDIDPTKAWPAIAAEHIRIYRTLAGGHAQRGLA